MRFGIIGTNFISDQFCEALSFAGAVPTAVLSRRRESGERFASRHGIPLVFDSEQDFFASDAFEAVYVASPNFCHEAQSIRALTSGKHVLCEKPIAPSLNGFLRMQEAARKSGRTLMEAMRPLHDSLWQKIREQLPALGTLQKGRLSFCQYSSRYDKFLSGEYTNTFDPALSNAALLDLGVYPISVAVWLFGAPVSAVGKSNFLANGFEGSGTALLKYPTHELTVVYSKTEDEDAPSLLLGDKGRMEIDKISAPRRVRLCRDGEQEVLFEKEKTDAKNNMHEELAVFLRAIAQGCISPFWKESEATLLVMDTLRRAAGIRFPSDEV